jgi:hypothetical protein
MLSPATFAPRLLSRFTRFGRLYAAKMRQRALPANPADAWHVPTPRASTGDYRLPPLPYPAALGVAGDAAL